MGGSSGLRLLAAAALCGQAAMAFVGPSLLNRMGSISGHALKGGWQPRRATAWRAARGGVPALRAQYVPGEIVISDGMPDHPVLKDPVNLNDRFTKEKVKIYGNGTCVTSYVSGGQDVFFVRPDAVLDGSKPISGGIPLCFPQFGPGEMQQHGFARNMRWECVDVKEEAAEGSRGFSFLSNRALAVFELRDNNYTRSMWPHKFLARYQVDLTAGCMTIDMRVHNRGPKPMSFQVALHSYYAVSDIDKIEIHGAFKGKKYLDKIAGEEKTEDRDFITIKDVTDSVYYGIEGGVEIVDGDRSIQIEPETEWEDVIIWNPYGDEKMGYKNFVCVENGRVGREVELQPDEWWCSRLDIKPLKNNMPAFLASLEDNEE